MAKKKWSYSPARRKSIVKARAEHSRLVRIGKAVRDKRK